MNGTSGERIVIPDSAVVSFAIASAPAETPAGTIEQSVLDCQVFGRTYRLEYPGRPKPGKGTEMEAMDLETGDIVTLVFGER